MKSAMRLKAKSQQEASEIAWPLFQTSKQKKILERRAETTATFIANSGERASLQRDK